jgi:hypothetical protein
MDLPERLNIPRDDRSALACDERSEALRKLASHRT